MNYNEVNMKINKIQEISTKGIQRMQQKIEPFEEKVQNLVNRLLERAEREVPEYGDFRTVFETLKSENKNMRATDYALKICKPNLKNAEKLRGLEAVAYDAKSGYKSEVVLAQGSKADILNSLRQQDLPKQLENTFIELSKSLEDI